MKVTLHTPGAIYSDGRIPESDREAARVKVELTLKEACVLHDILVAFSYAQPTAYGTPTLAYEVEFADDLEGTLAELKFA